MSDSAENLYGFTDDEEQIAGSSNISFGLNDAKLKKFGWIANGGSNGAEQEALDIVFDVNGTDKSYRLFPVTQAYGKGNVVITDPKAPEMKEAFKDFNAIITHILGCFVAKDQIVQAFSRPVQGFKHYCEIAQGLLPRDGKEKELQIFMQWQWQPTGDNNRTYLEIPKKMKHGKWLVPKVAASSEAGWKMVMKEEPQDNDKEGLIFVDEAGNVHPIARNGWWVNSNFAKRQVEDDGSAGNAISAAPTSAVAAPVAAPTSTDAAPAANGGTPAPATGGW